MKVICLLISFWLFLSSCASLPPIYPSKRLKPPDLHKKCLTLFPTGRWQFTHLVESISSQGERNYVMAVTVISTISRTIDCVIMTFEGLVLFKARQDDALTVDRAVYPFNRKEVAKELMTHIQLVFFKPERPPVEAGILENGHAVCRYKGCDGKIKDIVISPENTWNLLQYEKNRIPTRTIKAKALKKVGADTQWAAPNTLELTFHRFAGYAIKMNLVNAVFMPSQTLSMQ